MLTLADLKPRVVDVVIVRGQLPPEKEGDPFRNDEIVVPMRVPSWVEWNELGMEVPVPEPEMLMTFKNGKKVYEKESGEAYEAKKILANNRRTLRRLTFALIEAGNFPELKNAPVEEQMTAVGALDSGMLQALARVMSNLVQLTMGRVSDKIERFRDEPVSANGHGDMLDPSLDDGDMEDAASD